MIIKKCCELEFPTTFELPIYFNAENLYSAISIDDFIDGIDFSFIQICGMYFKLFTVLNYSQILIGNSTIEDCSIFNNANNFFYDNIQNIYIYIYGIQDNANGK